MSSVSEFERAFLQWLQVDHAFAFWNARTAAYSILKALGVGADDEIIVPAYTCWAAVIPILELGAKPVYVDIDPVTLNMDHRDVEGAITSKTRAVIAQHTFGCRIDVSALKEAVRGCDVALVEDATHCLCGAGNTPAPDLATTAAYWSFGWGKAIILGRGGMATTDDAGVAASLARSQARMAPPSRSDELLTAFYRTVLDIVRHPRLRPALSSIYLLLSQLGAGPDGELLVQPVAGSAPTLRTMGRVQARAGLSAIRTVEQQLFHRRKMIAVYNHLFHERGWPGTGFTSTDDALIFYPIRVTNRPEILRAARSRLLDIRAWWTSPLDLSPRAAMTFLYALGDFPHADAAYEQIVLLPTDCGVSLKEAERMVDFVCAKGVPVRPAAAS